MSVETHRVVIGACGWQHAAWTNDFYEEDLPEDWQLGFYANEFSVVFIPAKDWIDTESSVLSNWTEDVVDSFRFILEVPSDTLLDEAGYNDALLKAKHFGKFCLGLVLVMNQTLCDNNDFLQTCIDKAKIVSRCCLDTRHITMTNEMVAFLKHNSITPVRYAGAAAPDLEVGQATNWAVNKISSQDLTMPEVRKALETCLSYSNEDCISVLIFDGDPPSIEMMRNADTLLNLL